MIFRYPGGKTRLIPVIADYIKQLGFQNGDTFHDVFIGGGSVALHVAQTYPASDIHVNDLHPWVHAFWDVVSDATRSDFDALLANVQTIPTVPLFNALRASPPTTRLDRAYYAIFFNRTTFSGMFDSGPIGGQRQRSEWGISCRYNPTKLQDDLMAIRALLRGRMTATCEDGVSYAERADGFMYLDPPYIKKGKMLYNDTLNHRALAEVLKAKDRWLLSYDDEEIIRSYYNFASINNVDAWYSIRGKKRGWKQKQELIITRR